MGVNQHYLFEARQMQALSLAVHIPLACFGIAFPVLVLFAEYRYLRTGDDRYRVLARRWSRVMLALFAVGVVTGTILSFELGLPLPTWMADFGNVFGLGFTLEGFSFFLEAIFIGVYAYGLLRCYEVSGWWWPVRRWAGQARGSTVAAAEWFAEGVRPPEVARRLRASLNSVYVWRRRWDAGGIRLRAGARRLTYWPGGLQT